MLTLVLDVVEEFDGLGGASAELVAWELGTDPASLRNAWEHAIRDGLLLAAPRDNIFGEEMWRLTERGRVRLALGESPRSGAITADRNTDQVLTLSGGSGEPELTPGSQLSPAIRD